MNVIDIVNRLNVAYSQAEAQDDLKSMVRISEILYKIYTDERKRLRPPGEMTDEELIRAIRLLECDKAI